MQRNFRYSQRTNRLDFLRENAHLRVRTNMFGAIMRASVYRLPFIVIFRKKALCM
jgi:aspartyl/asparaginyl-tRNA synthetase